MALKDLLVLGGAGTEATTAYAFWLASMTGAGLTGAIPVIDPALPPGLIVELPRSMVTRMHEDAQGSATTAVRVFQEAAQRADVAVDIVRFEAQSSDFGYTLCRLARCFDISILPQPDPNGLDTAPILESVLFESGRPLIIVPYISLRPQTGTALIAWDGGVQAARAASDAIPLLMLARHVQIVSVGREDEKPHRSARDLARHLARHGINAETRLLPGEGIDVANMLLSLAADSGADLIVMGGYGHSRLREVIWGGTTREMVRSMTATIFMSH